MVLQVLLVVMMCTRVAMAQAAHVVGPIQVSLGDWTLTPLRASGEVEGFLALSKIGTEIGDNLTTVWYQKELDGSYSTWAWESQSRANAIAWLKQTKSLNGDSDELWPVTGYDEITEFTLPSEIRNGVFLDDPFSEVLDSLSETEKQAVIALLVQAGWRVATIEAAGDDLAACVRERIVPAIANGIEQESNNVVAAEAIAVAGLANWWCNNIGVCLPWTWYGAPTCGAWTCGGWTYTDGPLASGPCRDECHYHRPATRTCTRWVLHRDIWCIYTGWNQSRTDTSGQTARCDVDLVDFGCGHGNAGCPPPATCLSGAACVPTDAINWGTWAP